MSKIESKFSNFTKYQLFLQVIDPRNKANQELELAKKESCLLKLNNYDYEIKILKMNGNPSRISYKIKPSPYYGIMETYDLKNNQVYFQDYMTNQKYFDLSKESQNKNQTDLNYCTEETEENYVCNEPDLSFGNIEAFNKYYADNNNNNNGYKEMPKEYNNTSEKSGVYNYSTNYSNHYNNLKFNETNNQQTFNSSNTPYFNSYSSFKHVGFENQPETKKEVNPIVQFNYSLANNNNPNNNQYTPNPFTYSHGNSTYQQSYNNCNVGTQNTTYSQSYQNTNSTHGQQSPQNKENQVEIKNQYVYDSNQTYSYNHGSSYSEPTNKIEEIKEQTYKYQNKRIISSSNYEVNYDYGQTTNINSRNNTTINDPANTKTTYSLYNAIYSSNSDQKVQTNLGRKSQVFELNSAFDISSDLGSLNKNGRKSEILDSSIFNNFGDISINNTRRKSDYVNFNSLNLGIETQTFNNNPVSYQDFNSQNRQNDKYIKDKLSLYNQLHRNLNPEYTREYVQPDQIKIINNSVADIFIRLSNGANFDNDYLLIQNSSEKIFQRNQKSIYKLNFSNYSKKNGPVYNVKSGCIYKIDNQFNLISPASELLTSTSSSYDKIFEMNYQFEVFYETNEKKMLGILNDNNVIFVNRGSDIIAVKLESDSNKLMEDFIEIEPLVYVIFNRKPGQYLVSIHKRGECSHEYQVKTNKSYDVDHIHTDLKCSSSGDILKKHYSLSDLFKNFLTNLNRNSFSAKSFDSQNWYKLKNFIEDNPNKKKIKDFNHLLFRYISIKNNSYIEIYVRIKSRKIGSEEFIKIVPFNSFSWKRFSGEYLVEIVTFDMKSRRYKLKPDISYCYESDNQLRNETDFTNVNQIKDKFGNDNSLVYYDIYKKEHLRKEIVYDVEDMNYVKTDLNNNIKKGIEEEDQENLEYFNNKKPNYIPGKIFFDEDFPPEKSSLSSIDSKTGEKKKPHFIHGKTKRHELSEKTIDQCKFIRPKDFFNSQFFLYKDDIQVEDVTQGQLGNCYLMAVIISLSQRPDLIKGLFRSKGVNPDGYYELYYYENGKKKIMPLDDFLVTFDSVFLHEFMFAKPNQEELWVTLLEKAYAKYEGGYSNIHGGGVMYPELGWLTGAMTRELRTDDPNCWDEIYNACKSQNIITTSSNMGTGSHHKKTENNICNAHAYSILDAKEFRDDNQNLKLVKLKNPWGHTEWKGDYSDNCCKWTPKLKKFFGYESAVGNNGVFFMSFNDYLKEFRTLVICYINN